MTRYHLPRVIAVSVGILSTIAISACKTPSSDISKLGPDTYIISTSAPAARGGAVEAKRIALSEANEFCAQSGKKAFVTNIQTSQNHAEVNFRCEAEGQPKLQQP